MKGKTDLLKELEVVTKKTAREILKDAVVCDKKKVINFLLKNGVDVDIRGINTGENGSETALMVASRGDNIDIFKFLLKKGAGINAKDIAGWTSLLWASNTGNVEIVKLCLKSGANIDKKEINGYTPLMWASIKGHKEIVKLLCDNGADVSIKNKKKQTCPNRL